MNIETKEMYDRLSAMTEEQRLALDPICDVLNPFLEHLPIRGRVSRIAALAVVDLLLEWNQELLAGSEYE